MLLARDKFMPKMHLKQPAVHLLKTKKKLKSLFRLEIQILFTEMSLIKPVFSMIWLMVNQKTWQKKKKTQSDKVLRDKAFKIGSDPKYDCYQKGFVSNVF